MTPHFGTSLTTTTPVDENDGRLVAALATFAAAVAQRGMKRGFLNAVGGRSAASPSEAAAIANPDGKECCYVKCRQLLHRRWMSRGNGPDGNGPERVWVGSEHRCVYIPYSGKTDWKLYKPPAGLNAAVPPGAMVSN